MKCDYCKYKGQCDRKFYKCDRELVIHRNNTITCESKEVADKINLRMKKQRYNEEERVVFLGLGFNRRKMGGHVR